MDRVLPPQQHPVSGAGNGRRLGRDERHASHIEQLAQTPGFERLRDEILSRAQPRSTDQALDLGAGTGLLALGVAPHVAHVTAVDNSPAVSQLLEERARQLDITNLTVTVADVRKLPLPDASIDLALSNYCLHHVPDAEKLVALREMARVLRPGGRLVFGDMMFTLGLRTGRDRRVILRIVSSMVRSHPAGLLRVAVNVVKTLLAPSEHPASVEWWDKALRECGFTAVRVEALEHEGGIAYAERPSA